MECETFLSPWALHTTTTLTSLSYGLQATLNNDPNRGTTISMTLRNVSGPMPIILYFLQDRFYTPC